MGHSTPYQANLRTAQKTGHPIWLYLLLLVTGIGWGLSIVLATIAVSGGKDPISVTFWSTLVTGALLSGWLLLRRSRPPLAPQHLLFYGVTGLLGTVIPHLLSFYAAAHLPAGLRAVVFALTPMVTLLLSLGFSLENPSFRRFMGIVLGVIAIGLLFRADVAEAGSSHTFWIIISMLVVASYSVENVFIRLKRPPDLDLVTALWGMTISAIAMLCVVISVTGTRFGTLDLWSQNDAAIVMMSAIHIVCYAGFLYLISKAGSVFASQVSYIVTPSGIIWGVLLLGEALSSTVLVSLAIIMTGLVFIQPKSD